MKCLYITMFAVLALCGCTCAPGTVRVKVTTETVSTGYVGNGVEWDPYDEAEAWGCAVSDEDWETLYHRLDFMRPGYVRCMINSPFRYYDPVTGEYDRDRNIGSLLKLLQYCQDNGVTVVYGEYNPPEWSMKDSYEWVDMSVDYLDYLVNGLGFTCIRHFVIFNEPDGNWASTDGDYDLWKSMAMRFHDRMSGYDGLADKVSFAAPDVVMNYRNPASAFGTEGWVRQTASDLGNITGIYDVHAYPGQHEVRSGKYAGSLKKIMQAVPSGKKLILGEAGFKYHQPEDAHLKAEYDRRVEGHPYTRGSDCNMLCCDYFYGLDVPLLAMDVMNCGLSGMALWMLDDAMHSNGDSGKTEDVKIWGLWNILGEEVFGDASQEEPRPLYYTWSLMCRYFPAGCEILKVSAPSCDGIRMVAARKDGKYTFAAVNFSSGPCTLNVEMPEGMTDGVLYRYTVNDFPYDENGCPAVRETGISGRKVKAVIPAESFILLTDMQ